MHSQQIHHGNTTKIDTDENEIQDPNLWYGETVGSLLYIVVCTKPDLANAVRMLGRDMSAYSRESYRVAQQVVHYALVTKIMSLVYRVIPEQIILESYGMSANASCPETS